MNLKDYKSFLYQDKDNASFRAEIALHLLLSQQQPKVLLDLGSGSGELLKLARAHGIKDVTGIDGVKESLEICRQITKKMFDLDLNKSDLPFQDESFSSVTCLEVLEHLYTPQHVTQEIHRVLRKEGWVVISVPNTMNIITRLRFLFGNNISNPLTIGGHIKFFGVTDLKMLCAQQGLTNVKTYGFASPSAYKRYGFMMKLLMKIQPNLFATWFFVCGQKPK